MKKYWMLLTVCLPLLGEELPDLQYVIPLSTKLEMNEIPTESLPDLKSIFLTIDKEDSQLLEAIPLAEEMEEIPSTIAEEEPTPAIQSEEKKNLN